MAETHEPATGCVRVVVELALDPEGRPIGWVGPDGDAPARFAGWLALMAELARLVPAAPRADEPRTARDGGRSQ